MTEHESATPLRVLVVEDEAGLCELACLWVESLGFDAVGVESAAHALERLAAEPFDVLFSDVMMPGPMDGVELAHEARRLYPGLRIVLNSGYAQRLLDDPNVPGVVLAKPYNRKDLADAINRSAPGGAAT